MGARARAITRTATENGGFTVDATCSEYVRALCNWQVRCDTTKTITLDTCLTQNPRTCEFFALPGVTVGGADFGACASKYARDECSVPIASSGALGAFNLCRFPVGTATASCSFNLQCTTGLCGQPNGFCSRCAYIPRADIGGQCSQQSDCQVGLDCAASMCTEQRKIGESCDGDRHCKAMPGDSAVACVGGVCTSGGRAGEPCLDDGGGALDCGAGYSCLTTKICVPVRFMRPGEHCGQFADQLLFCRGGNCNSPDDPVKSECVSWPGIGESCKKVTDYERCEDGMYCDSTVGKCVLEPLPVPPRDCAY